MGCRVVISMLSALQADSETSRSWHLFRELLPKAVTTCSDCDPTEWERQRMIIYIVWSSVCTGRKCNLKCTQKKHSVSWKETDANVGSQADEKSACDQKIISSNPHTSWEMWVGKVNEYCTSSLHHQPPQVPLSKVLNLRLLCWSCSVTSSGRVV